VNLAKLSQQVGKTCKKIKQKLFHHYRLYNFTDL